MVNILLRNMRSGNRKGFQFPVVSCIQKDMRKIFKNARQRRHGTLTKAEKNASLWEEDSKLKARRPKYTPKMALGVFQLVETADGGGHVGVGV